MKQHDNTTILIVEDNPLTLFVLTENLKDQGFETIIVRSGEEAMRQVATLKPSLILLDIMMPGIDGFETCRRLKGNLSTKDIPIIFITALTDTSDKVKAFEVGGADYITKPVNVGEVIARVNTRLTIRKLQRQIQNRGLSSRPAQEQEKATLLIVDDNEMTFQAIANYLKGFGFSILGAHSGEEALQQASQHKPDLILLDIILPGIDGFETCRRLKREQATKDIPVIFMTALSDTADKVKAFESGGADYIMKPHHYAEVISRVNTHLTLRTLQRQVQKLRGKSR